MVFKPQFKEARSPTEASKAINLIHENGEQLFWPVRDLIFRLVRPEYPRLTEFNRADVLNIHARLFEYLGADAGRYRQCQVWVGNDTPPSPFKVPQLMDSLGAATVDNYLTWYQQFETIHPFIEGNGRVGGVVIAVLSFNVNGVFTVPDGC